MYESMTDRKNLKIDSNVYNRLADAKGSTDTWDEFLSRLLNSVEQGQMHLDRATLQDFDDKPDVDITLQASSDGELEVQFLDETGTQISGSTLSALEPEEEISLKISTGERKSD